MGNGLWEIRTALFGKRGYGLKILHYALGFPPYRTGGSTKFCMDLLRQQEREGHQTALMWPGRMGFFDRKVSVKKGIYGGIRSFEVHEPLPVPYDEGISRCHIFTEDAGREVYEELLRDFRPDVLHIHTLMGMHRSFLEAAKKLGIRCVFTVHDHFPICPKVTMVRGGQVCPSAKSCSDCAECNKTALSVGKMRLLQTAVYRICKELPIIRSMRRYHRDRVLSGKESGRPDRDVQEMSSAADYKMLREHYHSFLEKMDVIHYTSTVAKSVYESFFYLPDHVVIGISHGDIKDRRRKKKSPADGLRLSYLGPQGEAKGFFCSRRRLMNCGKSINSSVWISALGQRSCRPI